MSTRFYLFDKSFNMDILLAMKTYILYVRGTEQPDLIKAGSMKSAEKKAKKLFQKESPQDLQVVYTEI